MVRWSVQVGTVRRTSLVAATTPSAITSHFMMPPKMLTRMALTRSSAVMILKAAVIWFTWEMVGRWWGRWCGEMVWGDGVGRWCGEMVWGDGGGMVGRWW